MIELCASFPFRLNNQGGLATVIVGTNNHVEESITQILTTRKGERVMLPTYGCNVDFTLFRNIDESLYRILIHEIVDCLTEFETRIEVTPENLEVYSEDNKVYVHMNYTLKVDGSLNELTVQL